MRKRYYSLNILAAGQLSRFHELLVKPNQELAEELEAHLRNLTDKPFSLNEVKVVEGLEGLPNIERLELIGELLERIIGKPEFRLRVINVGEAHDRFRERRGLQVLRVKQDN